jgi:hypothetical protein
MRDAGHAAVARGRRAAQVGLGIAVPAARDQHDVQRTEALGQRRADRAPVAAQGPAALGPGEEVALVVGVREREHHAQRRASVHQEADRHRAAPAAGQVIARAVVGVDQPDRRARVGTGAARFLAQVAPLREGGQQAAADQPLRFGVRLGLVDRPARATRAVEVLAQDAARRGGRGHRFLERS